MLLFGGRAVRGVHTGREEGEQATGLVGEVEEPGCIEGKSEFRNRFSGWEGTPDYPALPKACRCGRMGSTPGSTRILLTQRGKRGRGIGPGPHTSGD